MDLARGVVRESGVVELLGEVLGVAGALRQNLLLVGRLLGHDFLFDDDLGLRREVRVAVRGPVVDLHLAQQVVLLDRVVVCVNFARLGRKLGDWLVSESGGILLRAGHRLRWLLGAYDVVRIQHGRVVVVDDFNQLLPRRPRTFLRQQMVPLPHLRLNILLESLLRFFNWVHLFNTRILFYDCLTLRGAFFDIQASGHGGGLSDFVRLVHLGVALLAEHLLALHVGWVSAPEVGALLGFFLRLDLVHDRDVVRLLGQLFVIINRLLFRRKPNV